MGTISVSHLGKAYKQYKSRRARLAEWLLPFYPKRHTLKWVLQDISFTVNPGEAVGIIGINGAGKSTLLKMITGTTRPTTGSVQMTGRVAAMLELGMGFHPDFTGRQNAVMAGQLLGYTVEEIHRLMPDIEAFAEIGDYIDEPVRVYSSGMQMRLAFSVATAIRPDILIVDEALSVGDAYFVHKSFDRIRKFREQGTTLLIVSHDKAAIQAVCDRAILLNAGKVALEGEPEAVMDAYNALIADKESGTVKQIATESGKTQTISGSGEAIIKRIDLLNEEDNSIEVVSVGQAVELRLVVRTTDAVPELVTGFMIKDRLGQVVFGTNTFHLKQVLHNLSANVDTTLSFKFQANLGPGTYSVSTALHTKDTHVSKNYEWKDLALVFNVINTSKPEFIGSNWLSPSIEVLP
ncbi:ABC transporter ATP-binding protein [Hydrogenophaga sp. H7]|uniref:ABC transporter ATP-binding protein n=1 Tax=Hydrogenophaga sp. H7 TaxID=1882399 RepID=UPI0009A3C262|nr:ABC transporter ATP-binding protein [Hydrogenophaga sp. H7]OPF64207.1 sugar ABC transporter ATP-binding protein [Hydrogenophaga sp. H7]